MRFKIKSAVAAALALAVFSLISPARAATYTYVGSWLLGAGPSWGTNPQVYTGQETAALLFGGSASDYVISTVDTDPTHINFKTWLDGWGDPTTYAYSSNPAAQNYSLDLQGPGYNTCTSCYQSAYSAYVNDHFSGFDSRFTNYAFAVSAVPEPSTWAMLILGFASVGFLAYRRRDALTAA